MKPLLVYAALVGLPVAGLAAVLHAGRPLQAPPHIAGEWQLDRPSSLRRGPAPREQAEPRFTISQSGTHVSLAITGIEYRGELRGDSLIARSTDQGQGDSCWNAGRAVLRARIDTAAAPRRMAFALDAPSSPECGGPFTAVRVERRPAGDARR
ncbi:MAG TPA: hypothetical protein VF541_00620 [Longimicrobium sp.]|jgi:hypothetical protein